MQANSARREARATSRCRLPTKFEMAVNLRSALGLAVPPSILLLADDQIE
jgi:hypothetical protein